MASKNYEIGRRFEYRVQNWFRKYGWYVMRAYASKGLVDLIAIPPYNENNIHNIPLGIQAKRNGYVAKDERKTLQENEKKWQMMIVIAWSDKKSRKLRMRCVNGEDLALGGFMRDVGPSSSKKDKLQFDVVCSPEVKN